MFRLQRPSSDQTACCLNASKTQGIEPIKQKKSPFSKLLTRTRNIARRVFHFPHKAQSPAPTTNTLENEQRINRLNGKIIKKNLALLNEHKQIKQCMRDLLAPIPAAQFEPTLEKGPLIEAKINVARLDKAVDELRTTSKVFIESSPGDRMTIAGLKQRASQRVALLEQRDAWAAGNPPASGETGQARIELVSPHPMNRQLPPKHVEQAEKHMARLDNKIASLEKHIEMLIDAYALKGLSHADEKSLLGLRNKLVEYRNQWAAGDFAGTGDLKALLGVHPASTLRQQIEHDIDKQTHTLVLSGTLDLLDKTLETAGKLNLHDNMDQPAFDIARESIANLRQAWLNGDLDASSAKGMRRTLNRSLGSQPADKLRITLEQDVILNAHMQLTASKRHDNPANLASDPRANMPLLSANIQKANIENIRKLPIKEMNLDLKAIYYGLLSTLPLYPLAQETNFRHKAPSNTTD